MRTLIRVVLVLVLAAGGVAVAAPVGAEDSCDEPQVVTGYAPDARLEYVDETVTDIYVLVTRVNHRGGAPQEVGLNEKLGTMDGGDVTSSQTDALTTPAITNLADYLELQLGFDFDAYTTDSPYLQTNAAVKGEADITFDASGESPVYQQRAITVIGPFTNRLTHYTISFYLHEQRIRSTRTVTDPPPTVSDACQRSEDPPPTYVGDGPVGVSTPTRCYYDCADDFANDNIEHTVMPNGGVVTGISPKADGAEITAEEHAQAGLAHDCVSKGGTMTGIGSCAIPHPDEPPDTRTCVEVVSESKPGQTAYWCE